MTACDHHSSGDLEMKGRLQFIAPLSVCSGAGSFTELSRHKMVIFQSWMDSNKVKVKVHP